MLICISGVSGAGKNTIINELTKKWDLHIMPTASTRAMRKTEFQMHPYYFMDKRLFDKKNANGEFFETCEVHKDIFVASIKSIYNQMISEGKILIKDVDVNGITNLKNQGVEILWIFIKTPTIDVLRERLIKRGNTMEDIEDRLSRADYELSFENQADYVVVNDVLEDAVAECEKIISTELEKRNMKLLPNNRKDFIVVYNEKAGKGNSSKYARKIAEGLAVEGDVELVHSESEEYIKEYFAKKLKGEKNTCVAVVGGDGTLGSTIDAIAKSGFASSVAVFPCGTANDFSRTIGMKKGIRRFVHLLLSSEPKKVDVALVNGEVHSIHAVGAGSFGHGSMEFSSVAKKRVGMFAYWLKCFFAAFKMKAQKLEVNIDGKIIKDEFLFFYATNGVVAGGFHAFAPTAEINDGKFDFVGIKKCNIFHFSWIVARLIFGKHAKSSKVVIEKGMNIKINTQKGNKLFEYCDVDGNKGPRLPLSIKVLKQKIAIYTEK